MSHDPFPQPSTRLLLRRFQANDLAAFQIYRHDPQIQRYQGWQAQNDELASAFLSEMAHTPFFTPGKWLQIAVALRETDYLIGDIGIFAAADGSHAELGFTFARQYQGQGYASEAVRTIITMLFAHTTISHINASADADNTASWRLMERVGMRHIGTEPGTFRNAPCIDHTYQMLRPAAQ